MLRCPLMLAARANATDQESNGTDLHCGFFVSAFPTVKSYRKPCLLIIALTDVGAVCRKRGVYPLVRWPGQRIGAVLGRLAWRGISE